MTREEWDNYSDEDKWLLYSLAEKNEADMKSVLEEIPECPNHGFCLPHFRDWIRQKQGKPLSDTKDALLMFDVSVREILSQRP